MNIATPCTVKLFAFLILLCGFTKFTSAQSNKQPLTGPALEKAIYLNQKSGQPEYHGIIEKYEILFDNPEIADKFSSQLLSEIKKISGVDDCMLDIQNSILIVIVPKEGEKDNRARNIERIKSAMAVYDLRLISYKEGTYYK